MVSIEGRQRGLEAARQADRFLDGMHATRAKYETPSYYAQALGRLIAYKNKSLATSSSIRVLDGFVKKDWNDASLNSKSNVRNYLQHVMGNALGKNQDSAANYSITRLAADAYDSTIGVNEAVSVQVFDALAGIDRQNVIPEFSQMTARYVKSVLANGLLPETA